MKFYNIEEIRKDLEQQLDDAKAIKEGWENVTFPTKKDGNPFKELSRNIIGADIVYIPYAIQNKEKMIQITAKNSKNHYVTDSFDNYEIAKYITEDDLRFKKKQNYQPKQRYLEQIYLYDLDDIKNEIKNKIKWWNDEIINIENQLSNVDIAFNSFEEKYINALKELKQLSDSKERANSLYYNVKDTVIGKYR